MRVLLSILFVLVLACEAQSQSVSVNGEALTQVQPLSQTQSGVWANQRYRVTISYMRYALPGNLGSTAYDEFWHITVKGGFGGWRYDVWAPTFFGTHVARTHSHWVDNPATPDPTDRVGYPAYVVIR